MSANLTALNAGRPMTACAFKAGDARWATSASRTQRRSMFAFSPLANATAATDAPPWPR